MKRERLFTMEDDACAVEHLDVTNSGVVPVGLPQERLNRNWMILRVRRS